MTCSICKLHAYFHCYCGIIVCDNCQTAHDRQMHLLPEEDDKALTILKDLVEWAHAMGGWEAPVWRRAEKLLKRRST